MRFLNVLLQIALIIAWYVVPSFASVPWFIIFLPTLVPLGVAAVMLTIAFVMILLAGLAMLIGYFTDKVQRN